MTPIDHGYTKDPPPFIKKKDGDRPKGWSYMGGSPFYHTS